MTMGALLQARVQLIKYIQIIREVKQMFSSHYQPLTHQYNSSASFQSELWMETQQEDSLTEEVYGDIPHQQTTPLPKQKTFWVYTQRTFIRLDTTEKLADYLHVFIARMVIKKVDQDLQAVLRLFHFAPVSFLSLLVENCRRLLVEAKCDDQLSASTIYTGVMMIEPERFYDRSQMMREGMRRLLKN